jgi:hypothetical protein
MIVNMILAGVLAVLAYLDYKEGNMKHFYINCVLFLLAVILI